MNNSTVRKFVAAGIGLGIPMCGFAQTIYYQSFDTGSVGKSLTSSQYGFKAYSGDLRLGQARHGWSGLSVTGTTGSVSGMLNFLYKGLPLPVHGLIRFSANFYSPTLNPGGDDVGIQLFTGIPGSSGSRGIDLRAEGLGWFTEGIGVSGNWGSLPGMHGESVLASVLWNQDTGEHWAEVTDGLGTFESPHLIRTGAGPMSSIGVYIERRGTSANTLPGDIDNLMVAAFPTYRIVPLYDESVAVNRGLPFQIKLEAADYAGVNRSSPVLMVQAVSVTSSTSSAPGDLEAAGGANPNDEFQYKQALGGYVFSLDTTSLSVGRWNFNFRVGSDPTLHSVQFQVK